MTSFEFLKLMNNMPGAHGGIQAGSRGPCNTFLGYATSGMQAVGRGFLDVRAGECREALVGGVGTGASEATVAWNRARGLLATGPEDAPAAWSRPLDEGATGLVPGDGAGFLALEEAESARARGATVRGRVLGYGTSLVLDDPTLAAREAVAGALADAGLDAGEVALVVASGAGVPSLDLAESAALVDVFGEGLGGAALLRPSATYGWTEAASGPLGVAVALETLRRGTVGPTRSFDRPRSGLGATARGEKQALRPGAAVILSLSLPGSAAALIVS